MVRVVDPGHGQDSLSPAGSAQVSSGFRSGRPARRMMGNLKTGPPGHHTMEITEGGLASSRRGNRESRDGEKRVHSMFQTRVRNDHHRRGRGEV